MKKNIILFIIILLLQILSRIESFATIYAKYSSLIFVNIIGQLSNLFPFSIFEWLVIFFILLLIYFIYRYRSLEIIIRYVLVLCLIFTLTTGIHYHRQSIEKDLQFTKLNYTNTDLENLCKFIINKLSTLEVEPITQTEMKQESRKAMNSIIPAYYPRPKPMFFSKLMSSSGLTGIFSPFTIEANYNKDIHPFNIPFTMCHELAHLQGYMSEDEANFLAYLSCTSSSNDYVKYSGYLTAFIYITNELYSLNVDVNKYYAQLPKSTLNDLKADQDYWNNYNGTLSTISNTVNDTYLKMNSIEEGVISYQRFVGLIYSYYKHNGYTL